MVGADFFLKVEVWIVFGIGVGFEVGVQCWSHGGKVTGLG